MVSVSQHGTDFKKVSQGGCGHNGMAMSIYMQPLRLPTAHQASRGVKYKKLILIILKIHTPTAQDSTSAAGVTARPTLHVQQYKPPGAERGPRPLPHPVCM